MQDEDGQAGYRCRVRGVQGGRRLNFFVILALLLVCALVVCRCGYDALSKCQSNAVRRAFLMEKATAPQLFVSSSYLLIYGTTQEAES